MKVLNKFSNAQPARLVVLISGNGSNLQAVLDGCAEQKIPAQVVAVFSNRVEAFGLQRARQASVPTIVALKQKDQERRSYDADLARQVASYQPDYILLLGWMRLLSAAFLDKFPNRVINLHPALPGMFPGAHAIEDAFNAFRAGRLQRTGVMMHLVPDEGVDNGPLLGIKTVPILPQDDLPALEARIHLAEHALVLRVLKLVLQTGENSDPTRD
jgi:phosphoribosylglycinamide formyltransferase 1